MELNIVTKEDLERMKEELLSEIKKLSPEAENLSKKWFRTKEVCNMLDCSPGTLQNWRINGAIEYTKIEGTIYYSIESINRVLEKNKIKAA